MNADTNETIVQKIFNNTTNLSSKPSDNTTLLERVLGYLPIGFCVWDYRLDIIESNGAYADMLGLASNASFSTNFFDMSPEIQPDGQISSTKMLNLITRTFREGRCSSQWIHLDSNGNELSVELFFEKFEIDETKTSDVVFMYAKDMHLKQHNINELDFNNDIFYESILQKIFLQKIPQLTKGLLFCYDVKNASLKYFSKNTETNGVLKTSHNFPNGVIKSGFIYKNDMLKFLEIVDDIQAGVIKNYEIRIVKDGEPVWQDVHYDILKDQNDEISLVIGKLSDIVDKDTLKNKELLDSLTNCYNQKALNSMVSDIIESSSFDDHHTIWVAELFDINSINIKFGSEFADLMLIDMANQLMTNLKDCIVGRVYGKFVIFCKNCSNVDDINAKTKEIVKCFLNSYEIDDQVCTTACNIGASVFPSDGKNFGDLYFSAGTALEFSKTQGVNSHSIYDESMKTSNIEKIESAKVDSSTDISSNLCLDIFNILHSQTDLKEDKFNSVVECIGKEISADKCFILSKDIDCYSPDNIYMLSGDSLKENIKIPLDDIKLFFKNSDIKGVLSFDDLTNDSSNFLKSYDDANSLIAVKIISNGKADNILVCLCNKPRRWSTKDINTFSQISKILSVFM